VVAVLELRERPVQLHGSAVAGALLRAAGWRVQFDGLPARQGVVIVYPHTSNWDFVVGLLAKWSIGFRLSFRGKDSLFRIPLFGRWMRHVGGVPVDRRNPRGVVKPMVDRLRQARERGAFSERLAHRRGRWPHQAAPVRLAPRKDASA
jgi:1-acyl-sn-glycerol-3-phosphate acyltransferase